MSKFDSKFGSETKLPAGGHFIFIMIFILYCSASRVKMNGMFDNKSWKQRGSCKVISFWSSHNTGGWFTRILVDKWTFYRFDTATHQQTQNICITFIKCWTNEDVGPTLCKFYTNIFCMLGLALSLMLVHRLLRWPNIKPTLCLCVYWDDDVAWTS